MRCGGVRVLSRARVGGGGVFPEKGEWSLSGVDALGVPVRGGKWRVVAGMLAVV